MAGPGSWLRTSSLRRTTPSTLHPRNPIAARSGEESRVEPYLAMANLFDLLVFVCKENSESELSKSLIGHSVCY